MTLSLLRDQIWALGGEPTDLDPSTDVQYDGNPMLTWVVNEGQRQVASWKHPSTRRRFKIRNLYGESFFKVSTLSGTLEDNGSTNTIVFPSGDLGAQDDRYNGWLVEVNGETKLLVDYTGSTRSGTVDSDWNTTPAIGDTYSVYRRFVFLLPSTHAWVSEHVSLPNKIDTTLPIGTFFAPLKLISVANQTEIRVGKDYEDFEGKLLSTGDPTKYIMKGNRIQFDSAPTSDFWVKMDYMRLPSPLVNDTDESELPESMHWGIVLWGLWWIYRHQQENSSAYSTKKDFTDFMLTSLNEFDVSAERIEKYGTLQKG